MIYMQGFPNLKTINFQAEHEAILKKRENSDASLTWSEYKSMTFTLQVILEVAEMFTSLISYVSFFPPTNLMDLITNYRLSMKF
jgi:hypothetical protein